MGGFRSAVSGAYAIMQIHINVCGYDITLWQVFIFFAVASAAVTLFYGMME